MTYVASFFHAFSSAGMLVFDMDGSRSLRCGWVSDQAETVSRRVEKFAELMQSVWLSRNDYERRVSEVTI